MCMIKKNYAVSYFWQYGRLYGKSRPQACVVQKQTDWFVTERKAKRFARKLKLQLGNQVANLQIVHRSDNGELTYSDVLYE